MFYLNISAVYPPLEPVLSIYTFSLCCILYISASIWDLKCSNRWFIWDLSMTISSCMDFSSSCMPMMAVLCCTISIGHQCLGSSKTGVVIREQSTLICADSPSTVNICYNSVKDFSIPKLVLVCFKLFKSNQETNMSCACEWALIVFDIDVSWSLNYETNVSSSLLNAVNHVSPSSSHMYLFMSSSTFLTDVLSSSATEFNLWSSSLTFLSSVPIGIPSFTLAWIIDLKEFSSWLWWMLLISFENKVLTLLSLSLMSLWLVLWLVYILSNWDLVSSQNSHRSMIPSLSLSLVITIWFTFSVLTSMSFLTPATSSSMSSRMDDTVLISFANASCYEAI